LKLDIVSLLNEGRGPRSDKAVQVLVAGSIWQDEGSRRKMWTKTFGQFAASRLGTALTARKLRKWWSELEQVPPEHLSFVH
jgi:hypothetical protein